MSTVSSDTVNATSAPAAVVPAAPTIVLLIDDQPIVGHAVKEMLAPEKDIQFHFCKEPLKALEVAKALSPTVILQDLVMPDIDGLTLLKFFRANASTAQTPMIVLSSKEEAETKAQAFALGANDYLVKLPDRIELVARIRHHSEGYIAQLQRNEAYRKLAESERQLAEEMAQAARYVRSLLPPPVEQGPVKIAWRFVPSTQLGGDAFGYYWLDERRLTYFLLDVSGHGVGAALMAVSVFNTLIGRTLPETDFGVPSQVMKGLNAAFPMERHNGHYFTIWYGVYDVESHKLVYSGGGHPPALLWRGQADGSKAQVELLEPQGPPIGMISGVDFEDSAAELKAGDRLLVYSDGAVEICEPNGNVLGHSDFTSFAGEATTWDNHWDSVMDQVITRARTRHGAAVLEDDCSLVLLETSKDK